MKNHSFITILLSVLMCIIGAKSFAHDIEVANADGLTIYYIWINNNTELAVSYCGNSAFSKYPNNVVIPESVIYEGSVYKVTSIGSSAFKNCTKLTSVTIPNSVTSICEYAFKGCSYLTSVIIPNNVTSIGTSSFENCTRLNSVTLPNSVTSIGSDAFYKCSSLTSVTIPNSVTYIGEGAFENCSGLTTVTIPNSVTYIGWSAFQGCSSLNSVNIPNSITSIEKKVFADCNNLTSVTISNSVTSIGERAFYGCSGLTSVTIPNSVTSIGSDAFQGCSSLTSLTISNNVNIIGLFAFTGCSENLIVKVPMTNITDFCNNNCVRVITFGIGKPIVLIDSKGNEINELIIPNDVTTIGNYAFNNCKGLTSVTISNNVTSIGERAFYGCSGLTSMTIPNSVTSIGSDAFYGTAWYDNQPDGLIYAGKVVYKYKGEIPANTSISIREGTLMITDGVFSNCSGLSSIIIPNSVKSIGEAAFRDCSGLTSITIPSSVTCIEGSTFQGCTGLTSITIPNSVTSIGENAFKNCSGLTSISIPNSVTSIGNGAFQNCSGLTSITIPSSLTSIGQAVFGGCSGLTSISIPNKVTYIGYSAFGGCSGLTSISIPNNVTSIGDNAFKNCSSLVSIRMPDSLSSIGSWAFEGCDKLKYIAFSSDKFIDYYKLGNISAQVIMPQSVYDKGIPNTITNFATYSNVPMYVEVKSKGATSAVLELYPADGLSDISYPNDSYTCTILGLTPGQIEHYITWKKDDGNYGVVSFIAEETLTLKVQEPKVLSTTKARLLATTEETDDFEHYGFEWRQYNAPEGRPSNKVSAPLYNGHIVGTLNNLNPNVDYNYRPFYKSDSGETFYGEWMWLYTGDAGAFFEPEVYTKNAEDITNVSALLGGIWIEGTDDFEEKGFEYWTVSNSLTRAVGADVKKVTVSGSKMTATIDGLIAGVTYGFRSYAKTVSGTTYGEEKTFMTILIGDINSDGELTEADVKALADHIIGNTPAKFSKKMADVDGNGKVNVADIVTLNKWLNQ